MSELASLEIQSEDKAHLPIFCNYIFCNEMITHEVESKLFKISANNERMYGRCVPSKPISKIINLENVT
jgi:hypothetical protein